MREIIFRGMMTTGKFVYGELYSDLPNSTAYYKECSQRICWHEGAAQLNAPVKNGTVGEYVEILDAFEGDLLYGCETDEYNQICSSWIGEVRFDESKGRMMVFDKDVDEWFEVDDFMFDKIIGNVHEVKK